MVYVRYLQSNCDFIRHLTKLFPLQLPILQVSSTSAETQLQKVFSLSRNSALQGNNAQCTVIDVKKQVKISSDYQFEEVNGPKTYVGTRMLKITASCTIVKAYKSFCFYQQIETY